MPLAYKIRPYKSSDHSQLRALVYDGFATSPGSIGVVALERIRTQPPSLIAYTSILTGALLLCARALRLVSTPALTRNSNLTTVGTSLSLVAIGVTLLGAIRVAVNRSVRDFCEETLRTDLGDVDAHYAASGGGFWVAVRARSEDDDSAVERQEEEILGCVGLQHNPATHNAEIRRMMVLSSTRRNGIARALMAVALAHADGMPALALEYVYLGTTDMQMPAQRLYEQLGFVAVRERRIGVWAGGTTSREYRRGRLAGAGEAVSVA
ncbi:GNAT family acetyltransferase [Mycena kentingensis (nom. inval.)]|nr:GNAT family acetyltransferase [Mycena kentingensis (nom. inval.)]